MTIDSAQVLYLYRFFVYPTVSTARTTLNGRQTYSQTSLQLNHLSSQRFVFKHGTQHAVAFIIFEAAERGEFGRRCRRCRWRHVDWGRCGGDPVAERVHLASRTIHRALGFHKGRRDCVTWDRGLPAATVWVHARRAPVINIPISCIYPTVVFPGIS